MSGVGVLRFVLFVLFLTVSLVGCGENNDTVGPTPEDTIPGGTTPPPTDTIVIDPTDRTTPLRGLVFGAQFSVANAIAYSRLGVRMVDIYGVAYNPASGRAYVGAKIQLIFGNREITVGRYQISDLPGADVFVNFLNVISHDNLEEITATRGVLEITSVSADRVEGILFAEASTSNVVSGTFSAEIIQNVPSL